MKDAVDSEDVHNKQFTTVRLREGTTRKRSTPSSTRSSGTDPA